MREAALLLCLCWPALGSPLFDPDQRGAVSVSRFQFQANPPCAEALLHPEAAASLSPLIASPRAQAVRTFADSNDLTTFARAVDGLDPNLGAWIREQTGLTALLNGRTLLELGRDERIEAERKLSQLKKIQTTALIHTALLPRELLPTAQTEGTLFSLTSLERSVEMRRRGRPVHYRDGLVWGLALTADELLTHGASLLAHFPTLRHLKISDIPSPAVFVEVLHSPLVKRVTSLDLSDNRLYEVPARAQGRAQERAQHDRNSALAQALRDRPLGDQLRHLESVSFGGDLLPASIVQTLLMALSAENLRNLDLSRNSLRVIMQPAPVLRLEDQVLGAIFGRVPAEPVPTQELYIWEAAESRNPEVVGHVQKIIANLHRLDVAGVNAGKAFLPTLLPLLSPQLKALNLANTYLEEAVGLLATNAPQLTSLAVLQLDENRIQPQHLSSWASAPFQNSLRTLSLRENFLGGPGLEVLGKFSGLVTLNLFRCQLKNEGLIQLQATGALPNSLWDLQLGQNEFGVQGFEALAACVGLRLHHLHISGNSFSGRGMNALFNAPFTQSPPLSIEMYSAFGLPDNVKAIVKKLEDRGIEVLHGADR